ncbi:D-alanine-D-alanine ligase [Wolbachia endosymbiont of Drosophila ananassae]|nr:D-alanine-D-alanine ligase [Wolbachia endosymbiont of Drosophila ananassae]
MHSRIGTNISLVAIACAWRYLTLIRSLSLSRTLSFSFPLLLPSCVKRSTLFPLHWSVKRLTQHFPASYKKFHFNKFYDYEAKYTDGFAEHIFPAKIPDNIYKMTLEHALKIHQFLGCKTISRSDFRYNPKNNTLKMLEINTHPGFTELSLVPEIAKLAKGINFNELVKIIIEDSLQHKNIRDLSHVEQYY